MSYHSAVFGLLDIEPSTNASFGVPDFSNADQLDLLKYVNIGNQVAFKCSCNRQQEPYFLNQSLFDKIFPVQGKFACEICLLEAKNAKTIKDQIKLVLIQNAETIELSHHLILDYPTDKIYDPVRKQMVRIRRIVYELYYNVILKSNQKVLTVCDNSQCVCPSHLLAARSVALKVTPAMQTDIHEWASKNLTNKTIQDLIQRKYQKSISLRTIINIKKSNPVSLNLAM